MTKKKLDPITVVVSIFSILGNIPRIWEFWFGNGKSQMKGGNSTMSATLISGIVSLIVFAAGLLGLSDDLKTALGNWLNVTYAFVMMLITFFAGRTHIVYNRLVKAGKATKLTLVD